MQDNSVLNLMNEKAKKHFLESAEVKQEVAKQCASNISEATLILIETLKKDGKILLCGNGGSAAGFVNILPQNLQVF